MSIWQKVIIVSAIALVSGCVSSPSSQQPRTLNQLGLFQNVPLNATTYRIQFKPHQDISYGHAEEITLVKSAQFTLQEGYEFFKVLDDPSNRLNQQAPRQTVVYPYRSSVDPFYYHPRYRNRPLFWNDPFFDVPYTVNLDPVEVSYTIQVYKKELAPADAFEAHRILQYLGERYQLNADGTIKTAPPQPPR